MLAKTTVRPGDCTVGLVPVLFSSTIVMILSCLYSNYSYLLSPCARDDPGFIRVLSLSCGLHRIREVLLQLLFLILPLSDHIPLSDSVPSGSGVFTLKC